MAMTLGKDVSALFPDVLKNIATADLDQKKLVYLYLMYVSSDPDGTACAEAQQELCQITPRPLHPRRQHFRPRFRRSEPSHSSTCHKNNGMYTSGQDN